MLTGALKTHSCQTTYFFFASETSFIAIPISIINLMVSIEDLARRRSNPKNAKYAERELTKSLKLQVWEKVLYHQKVNKILFEKKIELFKMMQFP